VDACGFVLQLSVAWRFCDELDGERAGFLVLAFTAKISDCLDVHVAVLWPNEPR
jgi:hypothetical protein